MGLGSVPDFYEQLPGGNETVWYANFGAVPLQSYRAFKYPWTGKPLISEIALFAYANNCSAPAAFYASWNGATEIATWKYFVGSESAGTFTLVGTQATTDTFETFTIGTRDTYAYAIAYDSTGSVLGQTKTVNVYVPAESVAGSCGAISCSLGFNYSSEPQAKCAAAVVSTTLVASTQTTSTAIVQTTSTSSFLPGLV